VAQGQSKNKRHATQAAISGLKREKRTTEDGEQIWDAPRAAPDIRRATKRFGKVEHWDCLPKTAKLSNLGYQVLAEVFQDFHTWCEGGLTPRKYEPDQVWANLQTRILASFAKLAPGLRP
jgi:hypothetical protein